MYDIWVLVALGGVSVIAGFVDAVAGGGGLITIPALLWAGLPPLGAIATNKAQSIVGTTIAAWTYWRQGYVSILSLVPSIGAAFAGSLLGAVVVKQVDTSALEVLIPAAVIAVALYFTFSPSIKDIDGAARLKFATFVPVFAFVIGFYDGLFGPGTGSFFMLGFVALAGYGMLKATAHTKLLNFASNVGAFAVFASVGVIAWKVGLLMGAAQFMGAQLGSRLAMKNGSRIIKPLLVITCAALAIKLMSDPTHPVRIWFGF